ncbi:hypothetical protein CY0110_03304 [Crocosphaera chwakensis CCY0110]|uniref:Uncharacterized protein n=2 Tax=Crocosphaera TaxID=263510 RepID=A3IK74_9CHRO|nr:hypothetical protein CY0110_03304 [Crocosphaera chwakensis CCY0110]
MVKKIKLMTEYYYYPLWDMDDVDNIDPCKLPLQEETINSLLEWAETYNKILNINNPSASNFANPIEEEKFERKGLELWKKLQQELSANYQVFYFSEKQGKLLSPFEY